MLVMTLISPLYWYITGWMYCKTDGEGGRKLFFLYVPGKSWLAVWLPFDLRGVAQQGEKQGGTQSGDYRR